MRPEAIIPRKEATWSCCNRVVGRKKICRVDRPDEQKRDNAAEGCQDDGINESQYATSHRASGSFVDIELVLDAKQPEGAEAYRNEQDNAEE